MTPEEIKKITDEIYTIGLRNGGMEMKYRILKRLNEDKKPKGREILCIK